VTRFAFVDRKKAFYDDTVLCLLLKVSRSGVLCLADPTEIATGAVG
jgi:hypothetical protein